MLRTSLQVMLLRIETRVSSLVSSLGKHVKWVNWSWMTLWWFTLRGIKICEFPLHSYRTTEVENRYILQYICTYICSHDFSWLLFSKRSEINSPHKSDKGEWFSFLAIWKIERGFPYLRKNASVLSTVLHTSPCAFKDMLKPTEKNMEVLRCQLGICHFYGLPFLSTKVSLTKTIAQTKRYTHYYFAPFLFLLAIFTKTLFG